MIIDRDTLVGITPEDDEMNVWVAPDVEDLPLLARRLRPYAHVDENHWAYQHLAWAGSEIMRLCEAETGW